jgi:L-fucose mutarotase/ribose pyranase (RbsD/FucU family)
MPDSNAPERSASIDADDSGDEDVFHDAHFPAEEEAVSLMSLRRGRSSMLTATVIIATPKGITRD